jgi:hypothetical protein
VTGASRMAATSRGSATNAGRRAAIATIGSTRKLLGGIHSVSRRPMTSTPSRAGGRARPPRWPRAGRSQAASDVARLGFPAGEGDLAGVVAAVLDALGQHEHRLPRRARDRRARAAAARRAFAGDARPLERGAIREPLRAQPGRGVVGAAAAPRPRARGTSSGVIAAILGPSSRSRSPPAHERSGQQPTPPVQLRARALVTVRLLRRGQVQGPRRRTRPPSAHRRVRRRARPADPRRPRRPSRRWSQRRAFRRRGPRRPRSNRRA